MNTHPSKKIFMIHDIPCEQSKNTLCGDGDVWFYADTKYALCKGCFDCWLKTPGTCIMRDRVCGLADHLADCDAFVIVTKNLYGGFSTAVKGVVDRLIAFNLPYFKKIDRELHHIPRYDHKFALYVLYYGDVTDSERACAEKYVSRIALNLNNDQHETVFLKESSEWEAAYENIALGLQS